MRLSQIRHSFLLMLGLMLGLAIFAPLRPGQAQHVDSLMSATAMETFVKAHIAVAVLRGQVQAELAETKSKKPEVQATLREKLQVGTQRILKEHGLTDADFVRLTRRVSTDDVVRKAFDEMLARLTGGKGPG